MEGVEVTVGVLAHGAGGLEALGIPLPLLLGFVGTVFLATAGWLSRTGAQGRTPAGGAVPRPLAASTAGRVRPAIAAVVALLLLVVALFGPTERGGNLATLALFTLFWFVLTAGSALLGPVHGRWSPLAPLLRWLGAPEAAPGEPAPAARATEPVEVRAGAPDGGGTPPPAAAPPARPGAAAVGPPPPPVTPAAIALALFLWAAFAASSGPITVAALLGWAALGIAGGVRHGVSWLDRADPFAVWSATAGWLAPIGRGEDGRPRRRSVRRALARAQAAPGLWLVVALVLGANLFELVRDALLIEALTPGGPALEAILRRSLGFALAVAVMAAVVRLLTAKRPWILPVLVPVAVGTTITLLLGPVLVEAQSVGILASDPFQVGWDLFGTSRRYLTSEPVPPALVAVLQLLLFLGGHVLALIAAHDRASARFDPRGARAVQFPVRAVLLLTLLGGVTLMLSAVE